jgi:hypothetical protein
MSRRVLPLVLLLAAACHPSRQVRPTPPPPFAGKPIDSVSTAEFIAYANTLQFDTTFPAADTLTVHTPTGDTIHLRAEPEIGAGALTASDIGVGRIIAKLESNAPFPPLGAGTGTTYFWVSGTGEGAHGVMVPADSQFRRFARSLITRNHLPQAAAATARLAVIASGGVVIYLTNGRCGDACCSFTSDFVQSDMPKVDSALIELHKRLTPQ